MKKSRKYSIVGLLVIISLLTAACAKKADYEATDTASYSDVYTSGRTNEAMPQEAVPAANEDSDVPKTDDSGGLTNSSELTSSVTSVQQQEKIIRTFYMDVETQEFDSLITRIGSEITRLGGYVESSQVNGKKYYYEDQARYGSIIARIPSDKVDEFVNIVDDKANVVNKQESSKNVSLEYIDAQSRVETLKIEQERLFAILDKEVSLENIITLESRLSDIRYELQNYESQIRYYDNQVAYSTVTMNIQEVDKLTPVTEIKQSVGTRIKNGFSNTMYHLSEGLKNFFVWFVVNLPYLLIWAIIIAAIWFIIRRAMKKSEAKTEKRILPPPVIIAGPQNMGQPYQNQMNQGHYNQNQMNQNQMNQNQVNQNQTSQNQPSQNDQDNNWNNPES